MKLSEAYLEFEKTYLQNEKSGAGTAVIGLTGMGVSHFLTLLSERRKLPLLTEPREVSAPWVIFNPDFLTQAEAVSRTSAMYRLAGIRQKIVLGVNSPAALYDPALTSSHIMSRWYSQYWLSPRSVEDLALLVAELGVELSKKERDLLETKSGGIARLAKFFALNREKLNSSAADLWHDDDWLKVAAPFFEAASKCKGEWLERMSLTEKNGKWKSAFLGEMAASLEGGLVFGVENDVFLWEFGERGKTLLPFEAAIVKYLLENRGVIGKDRIARFKWGDGSYDQASDQAIAKSMQRLGAKFRYHQLSPVPKVGYQIERK